MELISKKALEKLNNKIENTDFDISNYLHDKTQNIRIKNLKNYE